MDRLHRRCRISELSFYRYVDQKEAIMIEELRRIEPTPGTGVKWYSVDRYESGADAQRHLALRHVPTHRVGPIPVSQMPDFDAHPFRVVSPAFGQPGGGVEAATTQTLYLFDISALS